MKIKLVGEVAQQAFKDLSQLQQHEKKLLKTGEDMIDCHIGGLLSSDVVVLAGAPSAGKSETLYRMIDKIMSVDVNSDADKFVSLEFSMEMKMLNKLLRKTHSILNKKKSDILFNPFTPEERILVAEYYKDLQDGRRFVVQEPVTPKEFYELTRQFCLDNLDKEAIIISADHILLFTGGDKQKVLEDICEYVNLLKLEFNNVYFILLSQLNRSYNAVIKERSNDMIPNNSQLFGSSFMEQLASYIIIITNPYKQLIMDYLKVNPERYNYLSDFYSDEDNNGKVSFSTVANLFFFTTKTRESDNPWKDLHIKKLDLSEEQLKMMELIKEEKAMSFSSPQFEMPTFNPQEVF